MHGLSSSSKGFWKGFVLLKFSHDNSSQMMVKVLSFTVLRRFSLTPSHLEFTVEGFLKALLLFTLYDTDSHCAIAFYGTSASLFSSVWSVNRGKIASTWLFWNRNERTPWCYLLHGAANQSFTFIIHINLCAVLCCWSDCLVPDAEAMSWAGV